MIFRQLFDPVSCTWTYLLAEPDSKKAALIDPVFEHHARDAALIRELGLDLVYTLDTHIHADHVTGAWLMKRAFGSQIALSGRYGVGEVDAPLDQGDALTFGNLADEVRATPGHTSGCLTYILAGQGCAFTGDALLIRGAGRTDFQGGSAQTLFASITEQIFTLPEDTLLYPAHDYSGRTVTTVAEERRFNPRVGGRASREDFVGFMNNLGLSHPKKIDIAVPANTRLGKPDDAFEHAPATWGPVVRTFANIPQINPEWVATHMDAVFVLDVRSQEEFDGPLGHLAGAHLLPLEALRDRLDEVPKDKPVIAVCRSGMRSGQAARILEDAGRERIANLEGGVLEWHRQALPIEGGTRG